MENSPRARLRAEDPDALRHLFDEPAAVVHRHAVRMTGNWGTADDSIVSLTFLEAWRLRERVLPGDGSLRPWLLRIATDVAVADPTQTMSIRRASSASAQPAPLSWESAPRTRRVRCRSARPE